MVSTREQISTVVWRVGCLRKAKDLEYKVLTRSLLEYFLESKFSVFSLMELRRSSVIIMPLIH